MRLTARGRRIIDAAVETHLQNEQRLLRSFTAAERRTLDGLVRRLQHEAGGSERGRD